MSHDPKRNARQEGQQVQRSSFVNRSLGRSNVVESDEALQQTVRPEKHAGNVIVAYRVCGDGRAEKQQGEQNPECGCNGKVSHRLSLRYRSKAVAAVSAIGQKRTLIYLIEAETRPLLAGGNRRGWTT